MDGHVILLLILAGFSLLGALLVYMFGLGRWPKPVNRRLIACFIVLCLILLGLSATRL